MNYNQTRKLRCSYSHTYRNKSIVRDPFLYVPDNFISSPLQKHSRACTHPIDKMSIISPNKRSKQMTIVIVLITQRADTSGNHHLVFKVIDANLLSVLFPVVLSTTVDFAICGLARFIRYSHSSLDCSQSFQFNTKLSSNLIRYSLIINN